MSSHWFAVACGIIFICRPNDAQQPGGGGHHPCLLSCKDQHMYAIQNVLGDVSEWSLEFITPIQSILNRSPQGPATALMRIGAICQANQIYKKCLKACEPGKAREILIIGLSPWDYICKAYEEQGDFNLEIIPCWSENTLTLNQNCAKFGLALHESLRGMALAGADNPGYANHLPKICNAITYYDKCFLTESDRFCGEKGWNFLLRLNEVTSKALYEMLRYAAVIDQIPVACELWHSPQNYAAKHRQRLLGVRAVSNSSSAKPSALLPSTILCILMLLSSSFLLSLLFRSC